MLLTFEKIKEYYELELWSISMVADAVAKGKITADQYQEITGEVY